MQSEKRRQVLCVWISSTYNLSCKDKKLDCEQAIVFIVNTSCGTTYYLKIVPDINSGMSQSVKEGS
jgi:hypothetical protein